MSILVVSTMRDEGPFILEWIAHYLHLGATHFLIFTNDCFDQTEEILTLLAKEGLVTHINNDAPGKQTPHWRALNMASRHTLARTHDWILVADADEFANIHVGNGRFPDLLDHINGEFDAIAMPWRLFGNSGRLVFEDLPVTEQFTHCARPGYCGVIASLYFKTMVRAGTNYQKLGVHRPKNLRDGPFLKWVDGSGQPLPASFAEDDKLLRLPAGISSSVPLIELNHYSLKAAESFVLKSNRGLAASSRKAVDLGYWVERNFNSVQNTTIARYHPDTLPLRESLMSLPGMRYAHQRAVSGHKQKITKLLKQHDNIMLLRRIMVAGSSEGFPPEHEARFQTFFARANTP
ncbi:MAG: glycosyltransferase family 2 protein [Paracoccus sp. (in: a-proteobacteria)]